MKIKALIVDDDEIHLKILMMFLKKLSFEGSTALNGVEAVNLMKSGHYDICFMDIQMPVMDGIEATRTIKKEIDKDIPIIAVTALSEFNYDKSIEMGLDDYLSKPVSLAQLKDVINKHCKQNISD